MRVEWLESAVNRLIAYFHWTRGASVGVAVVNAGFTEILEEEVSGSGVKVVGIDYDDTTPAVKWIDGGDTLPSSTGKSKYMVLQIDTPASTGVDPVYVWDFVKMT